VQQPLSTPISVLRLTQLSAVQRKKQYVIYFQQGLEMILLDRRFQLASLGALRASYLRGI